MLIRSSYSRWDTKSQENVELSGGRRKARMAPNRQNGIGPIRGRREATRASSSQNSNAWPPSDQERAEWPVSQSGAPSNRRQQRSGGRPKKPGACRVARTAPSSHQESAKLLAKRRSARGTPNNQETSCKSVTEQLEGRCVIGRAPSGHEAAEQLPVSKRLSGPDVIPGCLFLLD